MVTMHSREVPEPNLKAGQSKTSVDPNGQIASLEAHMKRMSKTMEVLQKQNEDLISPFPLREDQKHEERCKEKHPEDDQKSSTLDNHETTIQDSSHHERHQETPNVDDEVRDLKLKYAEMALQKAQGEGEDRSVVDDLIQNTNLPFTDWVIRFPLPKKFKVPHINRYDGNGDLVNHMESICAHLVLHNTPEEITCQAFPLTFERQCPRIVWKAAFQFCRQPQVPQTLVLNPIFSNPKEEEVSLLLVVLNSRKERVLEGLHDEVQPREVRRGEPKGRNVMATLMNGIKIEEKLMAELAQKLALTTLHQFMSKVEEFINQEETIKALLKSKS